ncbi:uncharacterized protein FMAN_15404 [Fusarium mangiferae]|uniref:Uncharacterized protein n=1 Tax=Fusarium mangiferae TaxID=192010 RepID=A0A1L7UIL6_FUSMA|nr:uncharacterized protein FMAN_15404 [Fusarium mangiferae]CVL09052.1 uncharacterized protein FMAN_15404 [Fusarium mangiferae]
MTTFVNVNQSVALNNNVAALLLIYNPPAYANPSQTNGVNTTAFPGVLCLPDINPYLGAVGYIANVGVIWRGPVNGQVSLQILNNVTEGAGKSGRTETFTVGKWSDLDIGALEEAASSIRKTLNVPDGISDEIRDALAKVLDAIETELQKKLSG